MRPPGGPGRPDRPEPPRTPPGLSAKLPPHRLPMHRPRQLPHEAHLERALVARQVPGTVTNELGLAQPFRGAGCLRPEVWVRNDEGADRFAVCRVLDTDHCR